MDNVFFGVEKYCYCKYYGDVNDVENFNWFVIKKEIPMLNGFPFDHMIYDYEEIFNVENEVGYYEIKYDDITRYFKKINIISYIINSYNLKQCYLSIDYLVSKNINFYFLIDSGDYLSINNIFLSDKILNLVKDKKCKILLNISYEPYSNEKYDLVHVLDNFTRKYNLEKGDILILTGNLIVVNDDTKNYEFIPYCYFLDNPWFMQKDAHISETFYQSQSKIINEKNINSKNRFLKINREIKKFDKKILCYNRRPHPHRRYLFYTLYNDDLIYQNTFLSLNNENNYYIKYDQYFNITNNLSNKINEFYYNSPKSWSFDGKDLNYNLADQFDDEFHKKTFVSVVSETSMLPNVIFFSEKTFKPIYACQPFIIFGNPFSLKKLKEFGFKTFDKWWDESYDEELDFIVRLEKIKNILREISLKSDEELSLMLNEMSDILEYNFDIFLKYKSQSLIKILTKKIKNNSNLI